MLMVSLCRVLFVLLCWGNGVNELSQLHLKVSKNVSGSKMYYNYVKSSPSVSSTFSFLDTTDSLESSALCLLHASEMLLAMELRVHAGFLSCWQYDTDTREKFAFE